MYKAIFIDIDGTLRNNLRKVTQKTINAVKQVVNKGILVVICSGRPRKYTEDVSKECGASNYIISSNGSSIYDYDKKQVLYENIMNKEACKRLYELSEKEDIRFIMNVGDGRVVNKLHSKDNIEEKLETDIEEFLSNNNVVQCTLADSNFEKMKSLKKYIEQIPNVVIKNQHKSLVNPNAPKDGSIYYDVSNVGVNKGTGIQKFCELLNISLKDVIAIGDDKNDVPMFEIAGLSVAMENANEEVKKYADIITLSNEEDGVAIFLEKLCNGE